MAKRNILTPARKAEAKLARQLEEREIVDEVKAYLEFTATYINENQSIPQNEGIMDRYLQIVGFAKYDNVCYKTFPRIRLKIIAATSTKGGMVKIGCSLFGHNALPLRWFDPIELAHYSAYNRVQG